MLPLCVHLYHHTVLSTRAIPATVAYDHISLGHILVVERSDCIPAEYSLVGLCRQSTEHSLGRVNRLRTSNFRVPALDTCICTLALFPALVSTGVIALMVMFTLSWAATEHNIATIYLPFNRL